jgi:cytochrome o ubiquinol oxidase subunit 2
MDETGKPAHDARPLRRRLPTRLAPVRPGPVVASLLAAGCGGCSGVLDPQGPIGAANRQILLNSLAIMLCIVVPTVLATLAFAWWFRAGNARAVHRPAFVYSGRLELLVWSIPALTILLLGSIAWIGSHDLDPAQPLEGNGEPLEIQVVSLDWKWLFIYPREGFATVNRMPVPVGRPLQLSLTSASVMNAFFVPQLGSMIYTMNGMQTRLMLRADRAGRFHGLSSHFSGDGFPTMHFAVEAMSEQDFAAAADQARRDGPALDEQSYRALMRQSLSDPPSSFRSVSDGLFQAIVDQRLPPGPGPADGTRNPQIAPKRQS